MENLVCQMQDHLFQRTLLNRRSLLGGLERHYLCRHGPPQAPQNFPSFFRVRFHGMLELEGIEGRRAGRTKKQ
jgi:hypothetical protein